METFLNTGIKVEEMVSWEPNWNEEPEEEPKDEETEEDLHGWIGGWHRYMVERPEPWSFDEDLGKENLGYYFEKYEAYDVHYKDI